MNIVSLDVGGTKIFAGRYNQNLELLASEKRKTQTKAGQETVLENLLQAIEAVRDEATVAIGIAWAGFVNPQTGVINKAPNISVLNEFALTDFITAQTGLPCWLENDARCFAFGEWQALEPRPKVCLGIILGTGVGSGLIINGQIFHGAHQAAGEIGHMHIDAQEVESIVAGPGLQARFGVERLSELPALKPQQLNPVLDAITDWLTSIMLAYDPDQIVFGGGAAQYFWRQYEFQIIESLNKKIEQYPQTTNLKFSDQVNAGGKGMAALTWQYYEKK